MNIIRKIGKSKGIIIPKAYLDSLGLEEGTIVDIRVVGDHLTVKPAKRKYSLDELVAKMLPEHNIPELITGEFGAEELEYKHQKEVAVDEPKKITRTR